MVGEATLDEHDLLTLVTKIERILNDRPITALLSSPDDLSALTPFMITSGSIGDSVTPDVFMRNDEYRRLWRKTQYLSDKFWENWISQYLPMLQPRKKFLMSFRT